MPYKKKLSQRFRGFLPVIVDVETGGLNYKTDALLEIATVTVRMDSDGMLERDETIAFHVEPFEGSRIDPVALEVNKIKPDHPFRFAIPEKEALEETFEKIYTVLNETKCTRAVLVGHNANFDLEFLKAAMDRSKIQQSPFHSFTCFDTATLSGLCYGQTVLARALHAAKIPFDKDEAHSAIYDAEKTADLFCAIVNRWKTLREIEEK